MYRNRRRGKTEEEIQAELARLDLEFIDSDDDDLPPVEIDQAEESEDDEDDREETEETILQEVLVQVGVNMFFVINSVFQIQSFQFYFCF